MHTMHVYCISKQSLPMKILSFFTTVCLLLGTRTGGRGVVAPLAVVAAPPPLHKLAVLELKWARTWGGVEWGGVRGGGGKKGYMLLHMHEVIVCVSEVGEGVRTDLPRSGTRGSSQCLCHR